ncbi:DNA primase DnaG [Methanococcus aeolicus]|uniref:DNA primase DnaG n=1 Tax=Methanococcus aeolicus TaxID=42879 RepID=UPI0021C67AD0|nr:DNA primase DnaG [Methanococcus aeolicus]UXM85553.1 DNA primase DnaG [Methanococcus aeolicus]
MEIGTTKYVIYAKVIVDGYVEKHDIIGAIFGQTEGLLGSDLDLRDLQKSGRIGRIDVELENINGKSYAKLIFPSSLDRVETAIIAATIETLDRVGPCIATIKVLNIEDIRIKKRQYITDRAKELLKSIVDTTIDTYEIAEEIKEFVRSEEIIEMGNEKLPSGPNVEDSDTIIIVEGRADVLNLLRCGIKNAIAVGGTSIPESIIELSKKKTTTIFTDGDRGGELILKEAIQTCDIDYVARAPKGREVEELTKKEVVKYLRFKIPIEQYIQFHSNKCNELLKKSKEYRSNTINNNNDSGKISIDSIISENATNDIGELPVSKTSKNERNNTKVIDENIEKNNQNIKEDNNIEIKQSDISEILKKDCSEQWEYIESLLNDISNTDNIKIITNDNIIKTIHYSELDKIDKSDIQMVMSDMPITQKITDLFHECSPIIIGRDINITKKPAKLKVFSHDMLKNMVCL